MGRCDSEARGDDDGVPLPGGVLPDLEKETCVDMMETMITVNNLALLLDAKKGNAALGTEADQMYRRALPFTPRLKE